MMSDFVAADSNQSSRPEKRLTVVIPHFNQKDFLPRAVASILQGETGEIEIIIVDDGSTDGSESVLAALEAASPLITVIRCETNQGTPAALNIGLAAARGGYVTFLGADDLVLPNLYAPLSRALDGRLNTARNRDVVLETDGLAGEGAVGGTRDVAFPQPGVERILLGGRPVARFPSVAMRATSMLTPARCKASAIV